MPPPGLAVASALQLIASGDHELTRIVLLSLGVTLAALGLGCLIGLPLGAWLAVARFPGRGFVVAGLNAAMGLPPVVIGLGLYMLLSRSGPLGALGLLYTPTAMVIAQAILVTPIIAALARSSLEDLHREYAELFASLRLSQLQRAVALLWDGRYGLLTVALAGFGRAIAEVGAVIIVGGNIENLTRVMTTTIVLETSKGNFDLAMALGGILLALALIVNVAVMALRGTAVRSAYA